MPTSARAENEIIKLFVSAYETGSWASGILTFPDETEDGGVDGFVRRADGASLAIEHTILEPFAGDIADQSEMLRMLAEIESDKTLIVPGLWIQVFVPVGTLHLVKSADRERIKRSIHDWIRDNRHALPAAQSDHICLIENKTRQPQEQIVLTVKTTKLPKEGALHVRRQQTEDTFDSVVDRMLTKKLPKLVRSAATKRLLFLERRHMNFPPQMMCSAMEQRQVGFADLALVDEVWIVENIENMEFAPGHIRFDRCVRDGDLHSAYEFRDGKLMSRVENGVTNWIASVGDLRPYMIGPE